MEINSDLEKVKKLAIKLKELADRGIDGERIAAEKKLNTLLKKYELKVVDIYKNEVKRKNISFKNEDERMIVAHVIWSVVPDAKIYRRGNQKKAICDLTPEQYIEIKEKSRFYLKHFNEEKSNFVVAYILKNNLTVKGSDDKGDGDNKDDVMFNAKSVSSIMSGIDKASYINKNKMLNQ